jgi:CBS domain-containing protein
MAETAAQQPPGQRRHVATVGDVMRPPLTTVDQNDHVAAAAYLMRHAGATALVVLDGQSNRPLGIITEADIVHTVADGRDVNEVRIRDVMTTGPTMVTADTSIPEAAETMTTGHFRHLPVVGDGGLTGIVDIRDVCQALLDMSTG